MSEEVSNEANQHRFRKCGKRRPNFSGGRPESAPIKRIVQEAKEQKMLIDATQGRKTRAVIITDSNHVILTYLQAETIMARFNDDSDKEQA